MKLIILRHAKSCWDSPAPTDHDRPLAPRGQKASSIIGKWLVSEGHEPKIVLCSTAQRARQTWDLVQMQLNKPEIVKFMHEIYLYGTQEIMHLVQQQGQLSPLMVVGHNPAIGEFAIHMLKNISHHKDFYRYPTAAVTVCEFQANSWSDVHPNTGQLLGFTVPRDHK